MSVLKLYRGDSTKIKKFEFSKTSDWCYRGQGIYLTDSLSVAQSYRTKGRSGTVGDPDITLATGKFDNQGQAVEHALQNWLSVAYTEEKQSKYSDLNEAKKRAYRASKLALWEDMLHDKRVTVEKQQAIHLAGKPVTNYKIYLASRNPIGRITSFNFDRETFEKGLVSSDKMFSLWDKDEVLLEYLYDLGLFMPYLNGVKFTLAQYLYFYREAKLAKMVAFRRYADDKDNKKVLGIRPGKKATKSYKFTLRDQVQKHRLADNPIDGNAYQKLLAICEIPTGTFNFYCAGSSSDLLAQKYIEIKNLPNWNGLIKPLSDIGYHGYEYDGGVNTNNRLHRAFVIWEEDYINDSKSGIIR